jgi:dethiobiotin synthetase
MKIFVTGTDTGIGKTVFCAGLVQLLGAHYWKPVQSGLHGETDSQTVDRLSKPPPSRVLPERYRLRTAASPHLAAEIDGVEIDCNCLAPPETPGHIVIEGAGGVLVPLTRRTSWADVLARWRIPTVVCARTALGTINHTLLTLEALFRRDVPLLGVAFIGEAHDENARIIQTLGKVPILGRLPWLAPLSAEILEQAFNQSFSLKVIDERYHELAK